MGNCKSLTSSSSFNITRHNNKKVIKNATISLTEFSDISLEELNQNPDNLDYLNSINHEDIKKLPAFVAPITSGKVIKVYDGDTITIASKIPGLKDSPVYKFSVRLNGIDTPEMRTKNEEEKQVAQMAQKALSDKIMDKNIFLKEVKTEKYGRLLAELYLGDLHINKWMLDQRYAIAYGGGTKTIPNSWLAYLNDGII